MGYSPKLITFLALLLILNASMALGRPMSSAAEILKGRLIGSRPPRCERRCSSCIRCEAIQVPIVPQDKPIKSRVTLNSRGDNLSNYKPLSWKCKCGNLIFNP